MKTPTIFLACVLLGGFAIAADPLPSWNDGPAKTAITGFVTKVTNEGPDFVPPAERIAVFDNDGCLWAEQPMYFQAFYIFDRIKQLAPQHPEWKDKEPFASVLKGDLKAALAGGEKALLEMTMATHAGMTTEEFDKSVGDWLATAKHPTTGKPYTQMVYQPMLELLAHLRANGFKTFIVSGGGIDFLRVFAEKSYGVPPEQVVGSSIKAKYELRDGKPVIVKTSRTQLHRRQVRQTRRHPPAHRPPPDFRRRKFRRRFPNARMDHRRPRPAFRHAHPPRRCRPRVGL
jgi:phosphoglycolate phosphatase-like HAD superfamily hydrolase